MLREEYFVYRDVTAFPGLLVQLGAKVIVAWMVSMVFPVEPVVKENLVETDLWV